MRQLKVTCEGCGRPKVFVGAGVTEIICQIDEEGWTDRPKTTGKGVEHFCPACSNKMRTVEDPTDPRD